MGFWELVLIGVSLSMDAFAVSVCRGLSMKNGIRVSHMLIIAAFFGGFQAIMPAIGYLLGKQFEAYITPVDHWIAFVLLGFLGGKMILDVIRDKGEDDCDCGCDRLDVKQLLIMAVATSIDALAVGIPFPSLGVNIWQAMALIGSVTFGLCILGVAIGNRFGARFKDKATLAGGIALVLVGTKILLEHLGIINF
ncbi:MAG: manganese efflux pump [Clostridia bacterium]|nr:manganese efflux pump [Clostridia bacterium]